MGSVLSTLQSVILQQDRTVLAFALLLGSLVVITVIVFGSSLSYLKCAFKRFIRIQIRKRLVDPLYRGSPTGSAFVSYYRSSLCHLQETNDDLLARILRNNYSCAFFVDRSISFLSCHRSSSSRSGEEGYASINEFREKVPLTTYDDYRDYVDRMVLNGEKNLLSFNKIIYFATSSGTTGKIKLLPINTTMIKQVRTLTRSASSVIWKSLLTSYPPPEQRSFQLYSGQKAAMYPRSKDGTPIGAISELFSAVSIVPGVRLLMSIYNVLAFDLIESIADFETSTFVQLVFALAIPDIFSYSVTFASVFIHTVKIIEKYFEEISLCISSTNFDHSSLVRNNIRDSKLRATLNRALNELLIEYGGLTFRSERAKQIRKECLKKGVPGILHRLWPTLTFASTTTGGSFAMYEKEIQFYCGDRLPLTNMIVYAASEGFFGSLASIHTDEYFLSPTAAFFEFIKEEDVHQAQPKTLLISEIEPGNRYELVCTTEAGLVRYRMGDVINCTRFLCRTDDLVPLPSEPVEIPRIPLVSIAYRVGSLLNVCGEKTSEQHLMDALEQAAHQWREQGIPVNICDFTAYPNLSTFPAQYVIFLELTDKRNQQQGCKLDDQQLQILQNIADSEVDLELCKANFEYRDSRSGGYLGPLVCILVRSGTFSTFLHKELVTDRVSPIQIKPHRLLKNEHHIRFFYDHQIDTSSS